MPTLEAPIELTNYLSSPTDMQNVSNQPLSDQEIERYWRNRGKVQAKGITKGQAESAKQRIADAYK